MSKPSTIPLRIHMLALYSLAGATYLVMRWMALSGGDKIVKTALKITAPSTGSESAGVFDIIRVSTNTAGFYLKKLLMPLPLNFGINSISPHYFWLGLLALAGVAWCIYKRDTISYLLLTAFMLTSSAFLLPILKITWTPIAERYVYMASAFFVIATMLFYIKFIHRLINQRVATVVIAVILGSSAVVTARRNMVWQDNFALFEDTMKKSPDFPAIRNEYAIALRERGRSEEADRIILENPIDEFQPSSLNNIRIIANQGRLEEARFMLLERMKKKTEYDLMMYQLLLNIDEQRREKAVGDQAKREIDQDILADFKILISHTGNPFYHYRAGMVMLRLGNKSGAKKEFASAYRGSPPNSHYREAAKKLAERL